MSAPGAPGQEPDWAARPAGGWDEFRAARARFLATVAEQSALARLERAWSLPAPGRLGDASNPRPDDKPTRVSEPRADPLS